MRIGAAGVMARAFIRASVAPGIGASSLVTPSAASAAPPASAAAAQSATNLDQKTIPTPERIFDGTAVCGPMLTKRLSRSRLRQDGGSPARLPGVADLGHGQVKAVQTLGDDRDLLLLHPVLALGVSCRPAAAGRRAAPPRSASAEALRLPGRGAADRRRADPDAPEAAARLSRGARPLAPAPRHAAEPDAALLSDG